MLVLAVVPALAPGVLDLVARIQELGERYDETLGTLESRLDEVSSRVDAHLAEMGVR